MTSRVCIEEPKGSLLSPHLKPTTDGVNHGRLRQVRQCPVNWADDAREASGVLPAMSAVVRALPHHSTSPITPALSFSAASATIATQDCAVRRGLSTTGASETASARSSRPPRRMRHVQSSASAVSLATRTQHVERDRSMCHGTCDRPCGAPHCQEQGPLLHRRSESIDSSCSLLSPLVPLHRLHFQPPLLSAMT